MRTFRISLVLLAWLLTVSASVPQGAQRVPLLTASLKASCAQEATVTGLTIAREGIGSASDFLRIYVMGGNRKMSGARTVRSGEPLLLRIRNLTIPACQTTTVTVYGDMSPTASASAEHRFVLRSVTGSGVTVAPSGSGSLRVTPHATQASATVEFLPVHTSTEYGTGRTVARILLSGGKLTDQEVTAITFTNNGSARDADIRNLRLESAGKVLTQTAGQLTGKTLRLVFDPPLRLTRNQRRLLILRADVRASRTRTMEWSVEEASDVEVREVSRK